MSPVHSLAPHRCHPSTVLPRRILLCSKIAPHTLPRSDLVRAHPTQPIRGQYDVEDYSVPLLVLTIHDFVLQQTDPQWKVVDLKAARKHNVRTDVLHVFRQATAALSVHLVPFTGADNDPAMALLRGAHLPHFSARRAGNGGRSGAVLGAVVVLDHVPLTVRSIMLKRVRDASNKSVQFDVLLPTVNVRLQRRAGERERSRKGWRVGAGDVAVPKRTAGVDGRRSGPGKGRMVGMGDGAAPERTAGGDAAVAGRLFAWIGVIHGPNIPPLSRPAPSHPALSHPAPSRPALSHSCPVSPRPVSPRPVSPCLTPAHLAPPGFCARCTFRLATWRS